MRTILSSILLFTPLAFSQSLDITQFEELLDQRTDSGMFSENEQSYESFTQNQYANILNKKGIVDKKLQQDLFLKELNKDRIELSTL